MKETSASKKRKDDRNHEIAIYRLLDISSHTEYSRKFEIRVLLLNHLENATEEDRTEPNGIYHWAKLFRASTWGELKMAAKDNPRMESFVGTVRHLSADDKIAQACEARRRYSIEIATYEYDVEQAKKRADEAKAQADDFKAQADEAKAQADEAKAQADEAKAQIKLLHKQNEEKDALIAMLQAQITKEGL